MRKKFNSICLGVTLSLPLHVAAADDNQIVGTNSNDYLVGTENNDTITPLKGNDFVNGMDGEDYVVYDGHSSRYTVSDTSGFTTVSYEVSGFNLSGMSMTESFTDTLENVEFLKFDDKIEELNKSKSEIVGTNSNDYLVGTENNDTITPLKGNDFVNGMDGEDYVVYDGHSSRYTVSDTSGFTTVSYEVSGFNLSGMSMTESFTDTLENVEFLKFDDKIEELNKVKDEALDSDNDGVSDVEEIKYGSDAYDANSTVATLNIKKGWQLISLDGINTNISLDIFKDTSVRKIRTVQDSKWYFWFVNGTKKENKITSLDSNKSYFLKSKATHQIKYPIVKGDASLSEETQFNKKSWYMVNQNSLSTLVDNVEGVKVFKFKKVRKTARNKMIKRKVLKRINTSNLEIIDAGGYIIKLK